MKTQTVLIEKEDKRENRVFGCSGVMLDEKYVITTANIVLNGENQSEFDKLLPGKLYTGNQLFSKSNCAPNIVWKENGLYVVKNAFIFATFVSENIKNSSKYIFQNWAMDSIDNNRNLNKILSVFLVLTFEQISNLDDFISKLKEWCYSLLRYDFDKGEELYARTVPFGNREFIDSYSKGIVSNIFGNNSCFILSDCPSTPGSEGSPVYLSDSKHLSAPLPIGIILASVSWWKGEWVGLTLIVDIKSALLELIDVPIKIFNLKKIDSPKLVATTEFSLVQVYSGNNWGTAILLDEEKGIFITNSHVIENNNVYIFYKGRSWNANLIFKTDESNVLDLALIKSEVDILKTLALKPVIVTRKKLNLGDTVYSSGFSLFARECQPTPTLTKGCVSQINSYMLKTTCSIHPGASGGAILDDDGNLIGIIVCNVKLHENRVIYPRVNMAIPFSSVADIIFKYTETEDLTVLDNLHVSKQEEIAWKRLEGKL